MFIFFSKSNVCHISFIHLWYLHILLLLLITSFSNITDNETISGNILTQITDDFSQFLLVKHGASTYKNLSDCLNDFSHFNEENLLHDFANIDMSYLNDSIVDKC